MKIRMWAAAATAIALSLAVIGVTPASVAAAAPAHAVLGQVQRFDGGPIQGLYVRLENTTEKLQAITDKFGRWEMAPSDPSPHLLYVDEHWVGDNDYPTTYFPSAPTPALAQPISTSSAVTRVTFVLRFGFVRARLLDSDGAPTSRGQLKLVPTGDSTHPVGIFRPLPANDGHPTTRAVPGAYVIYATSGGPGFPESQHKPVTVVEAQTVDAGDLVVPDSGGRIEGTVVDSAGVAVSGTCVAVHTVTPPNHAATACTDAAGHFLMRDLYGGDYVGTATPHDGSNLPTTVNGGAKFTVTEGQITVQDIVVPRGGSFTFIITDFRGAPAVKAEVSVFKAAGSSFGTTVTTDSAGYTVVRGLPPGQYSVYLKPDKQWTDAEDLYLDAVSVALGQTISIAKQLAASDWVSGELTDNFGGKPAAGVLVYAAEQGCIDAPCYYHFTYTDQWGHYFIHGMEASWPMKYAIGIGGSGKQSMDWTYKPNEGPKYVNAQPGLGHRVDFKLIHTFAGITCNSTVNPCGP